VPDSPAPSSELDVLDMIARRFHYVAYANNEHRRKKPCTTAVRRQVQTRRYQLLSADRSKHVAINCCPQTGPNTSLPTAVRRQVQTRRYQLLSADRSKHVAITCCPQTGPNTSLTAAVRRQVQTRR
jgi:hypothetical protein